jgi:type IV pilus assembly protein PilV
MKTGKMSSIETSIEKLKKDQGFTLLEVLIAISIFAVGMLAIAAMQTSAIRVNSSAGQITELSALGMGKLEELMGVDYGDAQLQESGNPFQETTSDGYTITWNVTNDSPVENNTRIRITVSAKGKSLEIVGVRSQSL